MKNYLITLLFSILFLLITLTLIKHKKKSQLTKAWTFTILLLIIWCTPLVFQILLSDKLQIMPIYFDYIVYIGICFIPTGIFLISKIYTDTTIKFKRIYYLLFIIPIIFLMCLWTNDFHHKFFKTYSIYMSEGEGGPFMLLNSIYSYVLLGFSIYKLLKFSIKNSGFFSKQSLLMVLGISIPLIANILGTFKLIPMTIYVTPICFTLTLLFWAIAMFKFNLLNVSPIALQKIVDRISDSYIVLNESNIAIDFNKTFLTTFNLKENEIRNKEIKDFIKYQDDNKKLYSSIEKAKNTLKTQRLTVNFSKIEKIFTIEISTIESQGNFLGTIILFKDITQHMDDMETIKNNQDMLVERERLATLGQMIGGIAHNLKTPIFSIAGGLEGLSELVKEYEASIDAPQVTKEDMFAIRNDMNEWIDKMKKHLEYMSDVITAVKGQAVTFSENSIVSFHVAEAFKHIELLMQHDLKHSLTNLYITNKVPEDILLQGNMNGLIQVIDNLISNAIYAYKSMNKTDQAIDLSAIYNEQNHNIEIRVKDYGPGLPQKVQEKLFKEMITTKGKNGTGLGLFMSASNIKAQFNGKMTYETEEGKGTTFIISLPVSQKVKI